MKKIVLICTLVVSSILIIYGINWGLPSRWCVDEPVAGALRMIAERTITPAGDYHHPTFHYFALIVFLAPVLLFLKLISYPLVAVQKAASVSWIHLSNIDPAFSTLIYVVARLSSALFAVLIIYLSYRIAKKCYSKTAGIYSALFLSVTMGFISEAHTAKSTIFLILMVALTALSCIHYYKKRSFKKYIIPFFLGGLTLATKYNGGIVVFPLGYYLFKIISRELKEKSLKTFILNKYIYIASGVFIFAFFIGFPGILVYFPQYAYNLIEYKVRYTPQSAGSIVPLFFSGLSGYALTLKDIFGVSLFLVIVAGICISLIKKKLNFPIKIILSIVIPYYLIFSVNPKPPETKYIILIVPFLLILSSGIVSRIFDAFGSRKKILFVILSIVWLISLKYTLAADEIYAYKDIRYEATKWIGNNIGKDRKIVIIGLSEWVVHNKLFKDYDITLLNNEKDNFNPKYNRHFAAGRQHTLTKAEVDRITGELAGKHNYFVVYPVFIRPERVRVWKTKETVYDRGIETNNQKVVKEFSRKAGSFFWNPNLGGYEPEKIIISRGIK